MVAASSNDSKRPSLGSFGRRQRREPIRQEYASHISASPDLKLPSVTTCVTHLKLLAAFSQLKDTVSSENGLLAAGLRWTIFVAVAVTRFETWLMTVLPNRFKPSLTRSIATNPSEMDKLIEETEPFTWTRSIMPPLDVLMVLHSYMLNPHDFLHDCLRTGSLSLWKAGFPWDLVAASIDESSLNYCPPESTVAAFEERTDTVWSHTNLVDKTSIKCSICPESITVRWTELYTGDLAQMEKGNTSMPFTVTCPHCQSYVSQDSISKARLKADLELLLRDDVVMPGTMLSKNGLVATKSRDEPVEADAALLNNILRDGMATDLIQKIDRAQRDSPSIGLSSCAMNDAIIFALTEGSIRDHVKGTDETEKSFSALMKSAQRMKAVYDRNMSCFALDLVGAVIRQGVFVEKMSYFDWIRSPAVEHIVTCATERYAGFFKVMQQNPGETAVPTFDVDLIWHTHQLTPATYYKYSLESCNSLFIDHDDKIVDDVLNNSFDWTCEQFANLTGNDYDKCLCWCCAILEQDSLSSRRKDTAKHRLGFRIKGMLRGFKSYEEPSEAEAQVIGIQLTKFEKDYAKARDTDLEANETPITKKRFFEDYHWHHPAFAPYPEDVGAT